MIGPAEIEEMMAEHAEAQATADPGAPIETLSSRPMAGGSAPPAVSSLPWSSWFWLSPEMGRCGSTE